MLPAIFLFSLLSTLSAAAQPKGMGKNDETEKIKAFSKNWRANDNETFDGLWTKMKKEILSKQEN